MPTSIAPPASTNWLPDRKVLAGGISGVASWLVMLALAHYGIPVPPDIQAQLSGVIGVAVAYLVPPAEQDIVKRLNDEIVKLAAQDPGVPVDPTTAPAPKLASDPPRAARKP